eukprot:g6841.t1
MVQTYPVNGGLPCPVSLRELRACAISDCNSVDCQATTWGEWGLCSGQCGSGQQTRDRSIARPAQGDGQRCETTLSETRSCEGGSGGSGCGVVNCQWGTWSAWSGCTCSCGGGQRTRNRHIAQTPQNGGAMCEPNHKEEIEPCNTHSCEQSTCRDGEWGFWQEWSPCSASCTGGLRFRHRRMMHEANECGKPAEGLSRALEPCNQGVPCAGDVDCQFDSWTQWSACTRTARGEVSLLCRAAKRVTARKALRRELAVAYEDSGIDLLDNGKFAQGLVGSEGAWGRYEFDPLGFSKKTELVPYFREAELKHGRLAMLAWVGLVVPDFVRLPGEKFSFEAVPVSIDAHDAFLGATGVNAQVLFWVSILELCCAKKVFEWNSVEVAGDYGLTSLFPSDEEGQKKMRLAELKNGRLAMLAFAGAGCQPLQPAGQCQTKTAGSASGVSGVNVMQRVEVDRGSALAVWTWRLVVAD